MQPLTAIGLVLIAVGDCTEARDEKHFKKN
jgi:hypothetical protein